MGSTWTKSPDAYDKKDFFGRKVKLPTYLQFVPGVCQKVITSMLDPDYHDEGDINGVIAMPWIGQKGIKKVSTMGRESLYRPLLRGFNDVPTAGDPVLLCTFGGQKYYLGPLNTQNNPNRNNDPFLKNQAQNPDNKSLPAGEKVVATLKDVSFVPKKVARLHKVPNYELDFPLQEMTGVNKEIVTTKASPDTLLEGRHGNSIRIGGRNINPYVMISNSRMRSQNILETTLDGSIFCMLHHGSIRQHFPYDVKPGKDIENEDGNALATPDTHPDNTPFKSEPYKFTLADSEIETVHKSITKSFTKNIGRGKTEGGEHDPNIEKTIYDYGNNENPGNQVFLNTDRIMFNARRESIFLSAFEHIHVGSGNTMTFSTSNNFLFEGATSSITNVPLFKVNSEQVYIDGRKEIVLGNPALDKGQLHSGVLGELLLASLNSLIMDIKILAGAASRAIENRANSAESVSTIQTVIDGLDNTKDQMNETILSKIVSLK